MKYLFLPIFILLLLPGCLTNYVDSLRESFRDADCLDLPDCARVRQNYLRHDILRNQGTTIDSIWVLWLSDEVIQVHEEIMTKYSGIPQADIDKKISESKKKNITSSRFYILMHGDKKDWKFALKVTGKLHAPQEIKKISELNFDYAYKRIMGDNAFRSKKNIYSILFDVPVTTPFEFLFSNAQYMTTLGWN